jgi:hypothetical protein
MMLLRDEEKKLLNQLMVQHEQYFLQVEDIQFILFLHLFLQRLMKVKV